ncbi:MAG: phosphonate lyase system protein PhnH [Firmicutes bacterium]|nr:phosphonate lyase system protein PhnH [Bacillota bacterium]
MIEPSFDKVFDTQRIYREVLDAMARPGKINALKSLTLVPPRDLNQASAAIALTLLDSETSFYTTAAGSDIAEYLALNTGAGSCQVNCAEFIIACGDKRLPELQEASCGTLLTPEQGATVIFQVDSLSAAGNGTMLTMTGPGIRDSAQLVITGLQTENLQILADLNREYPLGVDVIYADAAGNIACVPRSSTVRWEGEA